MAIYYIPMGASLATVTNDADQDVWELLAPSDAAVKIHWIKLTSTLTTDERVMLRLMRRTAAGSGGGTGLVEVLADGTSAAIGTSVIPLVTTPGTAGDILLTDYWSQLAPWEYLPTPETRIVVPPSGRIGLNLQTAVAASRTWSGFIVIEEIG